MDRKPPSRLPGRLLLLGLLIAVAIGAGHTLLWRAMSEQLEAGWQAWVSLRRAQGWRVEHAAPVRGGWPLSATLTLDRVRLEGAAATLPGGAALSAERVLLRVTLPWLDRLHVSLPGQQRLRLGATEYPFTADTLAAVLPLEPDTPPSAAEVTAERLRIGTPAGGIELGSASLSTRGSSSATEQESALALTFSAADIELPAPSPGMPAPVFGRRIAALSADLSVTGPLPPGRAPMARAEAWRDRGGTVELRALDITWGPVGAAAAATLTFDEALQPMGAGTLRLTGAAAALEALSAAGLVGTRAALTARSVLPLLSRPNAETGAPEIEVPVTLEDRTLTFARIPVLRLDRLRWPGM
jgi:hypothetical protein